MTRPAVAIAHDYLTQRGGAERVVLALAKAFPGAPIHTTVYDPAGTFPEFAELDIRTTPLQRIGPLRRNPRLALPVLAAAVSRHRIHAEVTICHGTGWAHGFPCSGRKIVYAHNTARWLYQRDEYLANLPVAYRLGLAPLAPLLHRWDRRAATTADVILAGSAVARGRIAENWGRDAEVIHPPPGLSPDGASTPVGDIEPGFLLTVARLLPYKRVDVVLEAVAGLADGRLVVVGDGPDRPRLEAAAPPGTIFLPTVSDSELRWLYQNASALVTVAREDFGLTALEAMSFATPVVAVAEGGFRETVQPHVSGILFDEPTPGSVRKAVTLALETDWDRDALLTRAAAFSEEAFIARIRALVRAAQPPALADQKTVMQ